MDILEKASVMFFRDVWLRGHEWTHVVHAEIKAGGELDMKTRQRSDINTTAWIYPICDVLSAAVLHPHSEMWTFVKNPHSMLIELIFHHLETK